MSLERRDVRRQDKDQVLAISRESLRRNYPLSGWTEERQITNLENNQKFVKMDLSDRSLEAYSFITSVVRSNGIGKTLIDPDINSNLHISTFHEVFTFPKKYLDPVGELLSFVHQDYPREFTSKALGLIIKKQNEHFKGEALEKLLVVSDKKEEMLKTESYLDDSNNTLFSMVHYIDTTSLEDWDPKTRYAYEEAIDGEYREQNNLKRKHISLEMDFYNTRWEMSDKAYLQFMKGNDRDQVTNMATIVTFYDLMQNDSVFTNLTTNRNINKGVFEGRFANLISNKDLRGDIIGECAQIRQELYESI